MLSISRIGPDSQLGQVGVVDVGKNAVSLVWPWDWIDWFGQDPLKSNQALGCLATSSSQFQRQPQLHQIRAQASPGHWGTGVLEFA